MQVVDHAPEWTWFEQRGKAMRPGEGSTLTEHQVKTQVVQRLQVFAFAEASGSLTALTAYARVTLGD